MTMPKYAPMQKVVLVRESRVPVENPINRPQNLYALLRELFSGCDREEFYVVMLDIKRKVIGVNRVSVGELSSTLVHPRETFKAAIIANASSIIVAHNHPSADSTPSMEDIQISKRLRDAGEILGIDVVDHLIYGSEFDIVSMVHLGLMPKGN